MVNNITNIDYPFIVNYETNKNPLNFSPRSFRDHLKTDFSHILPEKCNINLTNFTKVNNGKSVSLEK